MLHPLLLYVALLPAVALGEVIDKSEGEICLQQGQERYRCVVEERCTASGTLDTCKSARGSRVVCCSLSKISRIHQSTEPPRERVSSKKCREYSQYIYMDSIILMSSEKIRKCTFKTQPLILGGKNAELAEYPHMAHLGYETTTKSNKTKVVWGGCGGSLISERYVLTAAHCIQPVTSQSKVKWASFGEIKARGFSEKRIKRMVVDWHTPKGYRSDMRSTDIGLLKLGSDVRMDPYVRPACLDVVGRPEDSYTATGWGRRGYKSIDEVSSSILQEVSLPHVPVETCNKSYQGLTSLPNGIDETFMLCAGGQEGKDTCEGDSGGPLQVRLRNVDCMYSIVGITSFSVEGCGSDKPGVYTRVYGYLDWIEGIVWPNQ